MFAWWQSRHPGAVVPGDMVAHALAMASRMQNHVPRDRGMISGKMGQASGASGATDPHGRACHNPGCTGDGMPTR